MVVAMIAAVTPTGRLDAQAGPPPSPAEVAAAQAALQAGQVDSAIRTPEGYFARNPSATQGRLLLGNAYERKEDLDNATVAYDGVPAPRPATRQATFLTAG